jgi:hypothetical protein
VCTGCKTSTNYFSCSGGPGVDSIKRTLGHITLNLCFYIWWALWVAQCIPVRPRCETLMHYFSYSGGPGAVFLKRAPGHVTPNLCFGIQWDLRVTQCILVCPGCKTLYSDWSTRSNQTQIQEQRVLGSNQTCAALEFKHNVYSDSNKC